VAEFRVLGPVEVVDGRRAVDPGGLRERTLLVRLALSANRTVSADQQAEDLWSGSLRGPSLSDVADMAFAQAEVSRLEEARLTAIEDRIDADLARGGHAAVTAELNGLVALHPLRERVCGKCTQNTPAATAKTPKCGLEITTAARRVPGSSGHRTAGHSPPYRGDLSSGRAPQEAVHHLSGGNRRGPMLAG
jgi:hypothetical protein